MKKYFLLLLSLFFGLASFSFAQESIKDVTLSFCNDGTGNLSNRYNLMVEPGQKKDLCIYVENKSAQDVKLVYSFPKSVFSDGGNQICGNDNDFSRFFVENPDRSVVIPKNSSVMLKETIMAPVGVIGMYYGCLAYNLGVPEVSGMGGGMFNMVVRKVTFVNMFVGSEDSIINKVGFMSLTGSIFSTNKNISASYNDDGDLLLNFSVKNEGNLTQNVSLSGKFYNPLGVEKEFVIPTKKLLPGEIYQASTNLGVIPFYKGLFSVRVSLTGEPVFEFDVSSISDTYKQPTTIKETASLFIFSWVYVILAVIILALLVKIVLPRKKATPVETA